LLSAALALIVLTGCWPFPEGGGPAGSPTPGVASGPTSIPQVPGDLNIAGSVEDPASLDPALASDSYSHFIIRQLFSGLVMFDDDLNVVPDVAEALPQVSADGKTYTFTLRRGVRFPDRQEVTANDFKYSIERATDPQLAGAMPPESLPAGLFLDDIVGVRDKLTGAATEVAGVQAPDPYTLVITLEAPRQYFLSKLASGPSMVVQRSNVESGDTWTDSPKGTGPFRLERWEHNQHMVLVANEQYYGGRPKLERINIWMGANATGQLQQYETGGLDVAGVNIYDLERVTDRNNPLSKELQSVPDMSVTYLGFNIRQKPFDDPKVREALSRVIDRQRIARVMFQERVRQAGGFVPPDVAGYVPPETSDLGFNVTRARELLAESTYKSAENLPKLRLYSAGDGLGPMLQDVLSKTLEIDLEVHQVEWSDYLDGLDRGDYPMFTLTWIADYPDPAGILDSLFRSDSPGNSFGYRNDAVDAALDTAASETDGKKRLADYAQIEDRILRDFPAVPLYYSVDYRLVKPYVKGLQITPMGILSLKDVYIDGR
jgi:peptide/nickel transport system substrate-binding protein/oligopeptide transport system substrate-binding protein